jgi:hypothetical protein
MARVNLNCAPNIRVSVRLMVEISRWVIRIRQQQLRSLVAQLRKESVAFPSKLRERTGRELPW